MGHYEDKVYHVLQEVQRLRIQRKFDKMVNALRKKHPNIETRDLFEMALNKIKNDN